MTTTDAFTSGLEYRKSSLLGQIERLIDSAEKAGRGISDMEQIEINGHHAEIRAIEYKLANPEQRRTGTNNWTGNGPIQPAPIPTVGIDGWTGDKRKSAGLTGLAFTAARGGTYNPDAPSYFGDLWRSSRGDTAAAERLDRHAREFRDAVSATDPELRALTTTNGSGGDFVPPLYLLDDYIAALRPGRATADALTEKPMPSGTDVINVPKIATGTTTAIQSTQNTTISNTDLTTSTVSAPIFTVAGGQTVPQQLLDQSPIAGSIDEVILKDLMADYSKQVGNFVLNGTGSGQPQGLFPAAGNVVSYTDASPAFVGAGKLYSKIAQAVQTVQTARYEGPTAIVMHPRRWAWIAVQTDNQNRPVVVPNENGPVNANGVQTTGAAQGIVGHMFGLPVIVDPNVATNLGTGTNQDQILVGKLDDSWLFEGSINAQVFQATYAPNLSVYVRLFNYIALAHRTPVSLVAIAGTGLIAPSF